MIIAGNLLALQSSNLCKANNLDKNKASEKLASGYRINRAADDSASLAISEKMRSQIRGLDQGVRNLQEGINLTQIADGALSETHAILQRMNELSIQAANGTYNPEDRAAIQLEVDQLTKEIDRIAYTTSYNNNIYPLLGGMKEMKYNADPNTINKLSHVSITDGYAGSSNVSGNGSLMLYATTPSGDTGAGGLGAGSAGAMVRVRDNNGNEVKVMLHRDQFTSGGKLNVAVSGDVVTFHYKDPALGIEFEMEQSYSIYNEIDEASQTGYSFYDIKYSFKNLSGKDLTYDIATAFDNFGGRYTGANPYYVNGTPHSTQMRDPANGGGNYQIVTPPIPGLGLKCELVTRISGDGVLDDADQFLMLGDTNSPADREQIWRDLYSGNQTSGGSGALSECDEIYGLWLNKPVGANGTYTTNVLQGIKFNLVPSGDGSSSHPKDVWIQVSGKTYDAQYIGLVNATAKNLDVDPLDVSTPQRAEHSIFIVNEAIQLCSSFRTRFGAYSNRMENSANSNNNISENTQAAESIIRDTDMAATMVDYHRANILQNVSEAMLAQSNKVPERILSLLS